jgi:toxin ParE1/3/4
MKHARISSAARQDQFEIWLHVAEDNEGAADRLIEEIDAKVRLLARLPELGRTRPEISKEVRHFPVGNYLIFYRPVPDGIEILRILHGARRLEGLI